MDAKGPEAARPEISIVVVTWNGKGMALQCLNSLCALRSNISTEVIVVDNASTDGTPEAIGVGFPQVRLIRNQSNLGFARANNIGMAGCNGKYICLVNSDVVVPRGCIEAMYCYMEQRPDVGMLGPKMILPSGQVGVSCLRFPTVWNRLCSAMGVDSLFKGSKIFGDFMMASFKYDRIADVDVLTGWFWMLRREAVRQVGVLDDRFFMYGEDIDWSKRFHLGGWRVIFYPEAEAIHQCAGSSSRAPTQFYLEMTRANIQYFRKYHGSLAVLGFKLATAVHQIVRMAAYGLAYAFRRTIRPCASFKFKRSAACLLWLMGLDGRGATQWLR